MAGVRGRGGDDREGGFKAASGDVGWGIESMGGPRGWKGYRAKETSLLPKPS